MKGLESIAAVGGHQSYVLAGYGEPKSLSGISVSPSAFQVAGISPLLGRTFTEEEVRGGEERLVVLSHEIWQEQFGGEPTVVGQVIQLNEAPHAIIGVMPKGMASNALFYGLDLWLPRDFASPSHAKEWVELIGRRKAEISTGQLRSELSTVMPRLLQMHAQREGWSSPDVTVTAHAADRQVGSAEAGPILLVSIIPLFVLLIAGSNIANILLARMSTRRHEIAVRFSLGAKRSRLIRQLLAEAVLLALCGGGLGVMAAISISGWSEAHGINAQFSPWVFGLTILVTVLLGIAVGLFPARRATQGDLASDLKEASGAATGGVEHHRLRNTLVIGQVAMATTLCIAAGLLVQSYLSRKQFDPGFDAKNLVSVGVSLNREIYGTPERRSLYCVQALERIREIPGVTDVEVSSTRAIDRYVFNMGFRLEGQDQYRSDQRVQLSLVSPNYLDLVNVRVVRGRKLAETDKRGAPPVMLVNQSFVKRYFPDTDPIGQRIVTSIEQREEWLTIVGIVPDRRNLGSREDLGPEGYLCTSQFAPAWGSYFFLARTREASTPLHEAIREAVRSVDYNQPVGGVSTEESRLQWAVQRNVHGTQAISAIGMFGLLMALLGIYGVVSQAVVERTHEIGVRMALGAGRREVLKLILKQGLRYTAIGLGIGCLLGIGTTFGISQLLFGMRPLDPSTYLIVALIFLAASTITSLLPSLRATRVDPMKALRYE